MRSSAGCWRRICRWRSGWPPARSADVWIPLGTALGSSEVPAAAAQVIRRDAIDAMEKAGEVNPTNRWQALEYWLRRTRWPNRRRHGPRGHARTAYPPLSRRIRRLAPEESDPTMSKRALITGAAGQDGTWLAAQLIDAGWQVFGVVHPMLVVENMRLKAMLPAVEQLPASVADLASLSAAFTVAQPDCIWHLAAIASPAALREEPHAGVRHEHRRDAERPADGAVVRGLG